MIAWVEDDLMATTPLMKQPCNAKPVMASCNAWGGLTESLNDVVG